MRECQTCRQALDPIDRFCRHCGVAVNASQAGGLFRRALTPEDAASYWRGFFRPFFIMAFAFFGVFFSCAMILVVIWFFMFRR